MKKEIILKKLLVLKDQLESNPWQYGWIIERIEEVDDLLNEQEEKPTEMTNNNQQKSQFWRNLDQNIQDHNSIVDDKTLIEQFVIECGKYGDTANIPDEVIETYIRREKIKMEEIELDAKESAIIKQCAEESTSAASSYSDGYAEGYKRAVELAKHQITQIEVKQVKSISTLKTTTTGTTRLCTVFVPNEFVFQNRCKNCGNERHQHIIPTNTK